MRLILHFILKEFLQFRRDRKMLVTVIVAPVLQLIFLGYAATLDVKVIHTVIFDQDKSQTSRDLISHFEKSGYFKLDYYVSDYNELTRLIDEGKSLMGLVIPPDFEKNIGARRTANLQTIFDGSDGNKAAISAGYAQGIISMFSQNILAEYMSSNGVINPIAASIQPQIRVWYNPDLTTRYYMLPAIVGLLIMLITTSLTSLAVVKEREIGTLEQLIVTPIKPYQMIIGKLVPFSILGFISVSIVLTVMRYWFEIEVKGSIFLLYFSAFLLMLSTLGLGLFVSTLARTQAQAMMISGFAIMMPMIYLSGFAFPIENMPQTIQYVTYLVPLRYFITAIRAIILKGVGFMDLWPNLLALFIFGVAILFLSSLRFRKKLE